MFRDKRQAVSDFNYFPYTLYKPRLKVGFSVGVIHRYCPFFDYVAPQRSLDSSTSGLVYVLILTIWKNAGSANKEDLISNVCLEQGHRTFSPITNCLLPSEFISSVLTGRKSRLEAKGGAAISSKRLGG